MVSNFKDKIMLRMSPMDFQSNGNWPTERDWDDYFNREYTENVQFLNESGDFISYEDLGDTIIVKDIISDNPRNTLLLWGRLRKLAKGKKIKGKVHISNYKLLMTEIRLGAEIVGFDGTQYNMEREAE